MKRCTRRQPLTATITELRRHGAADFHVSDSADFPQPSPINGHTPDLVCRIGEVELVVTMETHDTLIASATRERWLAFGAFVRDTNGLFVPAVESGLVGLANDLHRELMRFSPMAIRR